MEGPSSDTCVAGRYELAERLGAGGFGEVWRARDLLSGEEVALKRLGPVPEQQMVLLRGEVAALRMLRVPGVAPLLDQGQDREGHFLVMELASGSAFPGVLEAPGWAEVRTLALALLEALERVHAAGVVHRDLKPANVLVDARGRVTLVDFGISAGASLDSGMAERHVGVGTPAYAAPEQLLGLPPDPRSDLYSVGVMLFEVLSGRVPHGGASLDELISSRLADPAPALGEGVDVPSYVSAGIACLLAREPSERPRSAGEALRMLEGDGAVPAGPELPWLGGEACLAPVLAALASGAPARLVGPVGSGRSRALAELGRRLTASGRRAVLLPPGSEAFESLEPLYGDFGEEVETLEQARRVAREGIAGVLAAATVILADEDSLLDEETRRALAGFDAEAGIVRVVQATEPGPGLGPWREDELRPLFAGPDRIHHLQSDAAALLHRLTDGRRDLVASEVRRWVRSGLASWSGATLAVTRRSLDRLEEGAAAMLYPSREHARLVELVETGTPQTLVRAIREVVEAHAQRGRLGEATTFLRWGLAVLRDEAAPETVELARTLCHVAHFEGSAQGCDRVLYELSLLPRTAEVRQLEQIMQAGVAALETDGPRALALAEALPTLENPRLEVLRWAVLIRAGRLADTEHFAAVLDRAEVFAEERDSPDTLAGIAEGRGLLAYGRGDFAGAAEHHARAARLFEMVPSKLSAELNRASALLDDLRPAEAEAVARAARARAEELRLPLFEARAEWLARAAHYRGGGEGGPDHELFGAVRHLGNLDLLALVGLYEGAFAWRAGRREECRALVAHATRTWRRLGRPWPALLARSLELAAGDDSEPGEPERMATEAEACPYPRLAAQVLALLRLGGHPQAAEAGAAAGVRASVPDERRRVRFEVLATVELARTP